jgi:hypothetical protein
MAKADLNISTLIGKRNYWHWRLSKFYNNR